MIDQSIFHLKSKPHWSGYRIPLAILILILLPCLVPAGEKPSATASNADAAVHGTGDPELQVFINPSGARTAGAQWKTRRLDEYMQPAGDWSPWFDSGYVDTFYCDPEIYMEVEFKEIAGWAKPANRNVYIPFDRATTTGTYIQNGSIKVYINPQAARDDGAQWRRVGLGEKDWRDSGEVETDVPEGWYYVEFKNLTGWVEPANVPVQSVRGITSEYTVTFEKIVVGLSVVITPGEAAAAGAKWKISGTSTLYSSGETAEVQAGTYTLEFLGARGWQPPASKTVTVQPETPLEVTANYSRCTIGKVWIISDTFTKNGNDFTASGNVQIGFDTGTSAPEVHSTGFTNPVFKISGNLEGTVSPAIIKGNGTITAINFKLPIIGTVPIFYGTFTMDADTLKVTDFGLSTLFEAFKLWGYDFTFNYFQLLFNPNGVAYSARLDLPDWIYGTNSFIDVERLEITTSGVVVIGELNITDMNLYEGMMTCKNLHGSINTQTSSFSISVDELTIGDLPTISAELTIVNGKLKTLAGGAYDMGIQIANLPIYFQDLALSLRDPSPDATKISLDTIAFTLFERFEGWSLLEVSGNAKVDFSGNLGIGAYVKALGYTLSYVTFDMAWDYGFIVGVKQTITAYALTVYGTLHVWWQSWYGPYPWIQPKGWTLYMTGHIGFDIPDWLVKTIQFFDKSWDTSKLYVAEGSVSASKNGFECTATILKLFTLSYTIPPFWKSAPPPEPTVVGLQKASLGPASPASVSQFTVPQSCPAAVISVQAESGIPDVVVTLPNGTTYDSTGSLPDNSQDFAFVEDEERNVTAFFFRKPKAGDWTVDVTNSADIGRSTVYFVTGNNDPNIIPKKIEKTADGKYKLYARAYDPDDTAVVTFYWSRDNKSFLGVPIGGIEENDGNLVYTWTPSEELPFKAGYVYSEIKDDTNQARRVYFDEKLQFGETDIQPPRFGKCKVVKDQVEFKTKIKDAAEVELLRVYYSDDLKLKELTEFLDLRLTNKAVLTESELKPGRKYQIRLASVGSDGSESAQSKRRVFDFRAKKINNHPYFLSDPETEASVGSQYVYGFKAKDYDNDDLQYSLMEAPAGMVLDEAGRKLLWTPADENAGSAFVTLKATDGNGGEDIQSFTITVESASVPARRAVVEVVDSGKNRRMMFVRVYDPGAGIDPSVRERLQIWMDDRWGQETIEMTLTETSADSSEFLGTLEIGDNTASAPVWLWTDNARGKSVESVVSWNDAKGQARKATTLVLGF
jgi:hypothetical protein